MHLAAIVGSVAALALCVVPTSPRSQELPAPRYAFECERSFRLGDDSKALATRFGVSSVTTDEIYLGEGFYETGTVLFGGSAESRVDILWQDVANQSGLKVVRIRGQRSQWQTRTGLTLGLDLRSVERLNTKAFRMTGFGTDYEGTQLSWSGGRLGPRSGSACSVRVRLRPDDSVDYKRWYRQVIGGREFSSGHPAMQYLNPRVYEMWLDFRQAS